MRWLSWLSQLWHQLEPAERLDWILDTLGLRERARQMIAAIIVGIVMLIYQKLADAPIEWLVLTVMLSIGITYYILNQFAQWQTHRGLRTLAIGARPSISFWKGRRIFQYILTLIVIGFMFIIKKGPNGVEWPWPEQTSKPWPAGTEPSGLSASHVPLLEHNSYVSFSFPHGADTDVEIQLRFLNHEENPISVERIGVIELFGNDQEPYLQIDQCYDANIVEVMKNEMNSSPPIGSRTQGSLTAKPLEFVVYANPLDLKFNGMESRLPLEIPSKRSAIVDAKFLVDPSEKSAPRFNFFVVCPSVKLFDTRGQESVSVCPGLIYMTFSKEEYSGDSYRVPLSIARHTKHLATMGPSPATEDKYRVFAQRAGRFQLTPQIASSSCPLVDAD